MPSARNGLASHGASSLLTLFRHRYFGIRGFVHRDSRQQDVERDSLSGVILQLHCSARVLHRLTTMLSPGSVPWFWSLVVK